MAEVIDTPWRATAHASALKAAGVRVVMRYVNHRNSRSLPEKRLTAEEARGLAALGFRLGTVFQQRHRSLADFADPARDAARAFGYAGATLRQPGGSAIWFAVDHDFCGAAELGAIRRYFEGLVRAREAAPQAARYRIGAYGSGAVLSALREAGLADLLWLAVARGWSGTRAFDAGGGWDLRQDRITRIGALDVDANTIGARRDIGDWVPVGVAAPAPAPRAPDRRRVTARGGLRLRAGPGLGFDVLGVLPAGTEAGVLRETGGWAQIDLQGDGLADGFVHPAYLAPAA